MRPDHELHAIEAAAAAWVIECDGGLTPRRERELELWLGADERHAAAFEALAETWTLIGAAGAHAEDATAAESRRVARTKRWVVATLAAAAAIVALVSWNGAWRPTESKDAMVFAQAASTAVGMVRTMTLPDGTTIQLNTDSAVEARFEAAVRRVRLTRGEAYFTVAKDASRPFVVSAGDVDVRVVGTVFNVRLRPEAVDVLVTEGKVRVGSPRDAHELATPDANARERDGAPAELMAGQKVSVALGNTSARAEANVTPVAVTASEIRQTLAWQARRLDFDAAPLSEIVAEVNRYNAHKLVLDDPRLKERRFGGSFPANDHATLVRMLEADFGVVAERRAGVTVLRLKAP